MICFDKITNLLHLFMHPDFSKQMAQNIRLTKSCAEIEHYVRILKKFNWTYYVNYSLFLHTHTYPKKVFTVLPGPDYLLHLDYHPEAWLLYIRLIKEIKMIKRVAVFCGSRFGNKTIFRETAYGLGWSLAENQIELVFGGSGTGIMGALADGVIENQGKAIGVLPRFLQNREVAHPGLSELILVEDMHQRKAKMNEMSDAFIVLPGGLGTLEEFFEMLTWSQLGLHNKPILLINTEGFYDNLLSLLASLANHGFIKSKTPAFLVFETINEAIICLKKFTEF